jgi:hypothetical protein
MPSYISGTIIIPSNAPVGKYTFTINGGGISISEPSAVKIYNDYITPDTGTVHGVVPFTIYVNSANIHFYYNSNITFCDFIRFKQSNGSWKWDIQPVNPLPGQTDYYLSSPFILTGVFPHILDDNYDPITCDITLNDVSDGGSTLITMSNQFIFTV